MTETLTIYRVDTPIGAIEFAAPANLTAIEIKAQLYAYLPESVTWTPDAWTDAEWDAAVSVRPAARTDLAALPGWATWTGQQASDYIRGAVLNGMNKAEVEAWVDANITGTTVTQPRTQLKAALKPVAGEMIDQREIVQRAAQAIMYLRDMQQ